MTDGTTPDPNAPPSRPLSPAELAARAVAPEGGTAVSRSTPPGPDAANTGLTAPPDPDEPHGAPTALEPAAVVEPGTRVDGAAPGAVRTAQAVAAPGAGAVVPPPPAVAQPIANENAPGPSVAPGAQPAVAAPAVHVPAWSLGTDNPATRKLMDDSETAIENAVARMKAGLDAVLAGAATDLAPIPGDLHAAASAIIQQKTDPQTGGVVKSLLGIATPILNPLEQMVNQAVLVGICVFRSDLESFKLVGIPSPPQPEPQPEPGALSDTAAMNAKNLLDLGTKPATVESGDAEARA